MFTDKKIFILGMARSGYEVAKLLASKHNNILINDINKDQDENHIKELEQLGVKIILGEHPDGILTKDYDYLIKNPGISDSHKYIVKALEYKIPVMNEMELSYYLFPKNITIIGITGTNGKTTTTTLVYEILKTANKRVHLMGNIGFPVSSFVGSIREGDILVTEISCQQLLNMHNFKTNISVMTNLYEAHIDFFGNYEKYLDAKKKIFNHHTSNDYAILNIDNADVSSLTSDIRSTKLYFSSKEENNKGCYIKDNIIYYLDEMIINTSEIKIKGKHNYENIMAAILAVKQLGVDNKSIIETLKVFPGVEHRIEFVKKINNREIYNDSKSTNIKATQIALSSMDKKVVLILGGLDRGHSFDDLKDYLNNVKEVICYGETKERIKTFMNNLKIPCYVVDNLEEATKKAYELSEDNEAILLSPACASWDQFKDYEERGRMFKKYVSELK